MSKKLLLSKADTSGGIDSNVFAIYTYTGESSVLPSILPTDLAYTTSKVTNADGSTTVTLKKSSAVSYPTLCSFIDRPTVTDVACLRLNSSVTAINQCFMRCTSLKSVNLGYLDMSNINNLDSLFRECTSLESLDLNYLDVSKVTTIKDIFRGCTALKSLKVSNWTLSSCLYADNAFNGCKAITTLDLASWGLGACTSIADMFHDCSALTSLNAPFTLTNNAAMNGVFVNCGELVTVDLSTWNMSKVKSFNSCFSKCGKLTTIVGVENFNLNTTEGYVLNNMFSACNSIKSLDLSKWNTSRASAAFSVFTNCTGLVELNLSGWSTSNINNMSNMFNNCRSLTSLDISSFDTSKVTNMSNMFNNCRSLTSLNVSNFNTSIVTNMDGMFNSCVNLTSLDVSNFNTENTTNMINMFYGCNKLTSLDLTNFDTSKVTDMGNMFYNGSSLTSLDISSFDTSKVTNVVDMFRGVPSTTVVKVNSSIGKTESECSFSGTFSVVDAPVRTMYTLPVTDGLVVYLDARGYETGDTYMYDYSGNGHHGRFHWEDASHPNMFTKGDNAVCPPENNAAIKNWMDLLSGLDSTQNNAQTFVMSFIINDTDYAWLFTANLAEAWNTRVQIGSDKNLRIQSENASTVISGETLYNVGDRVFIVVNKDFTYVETVKTLAAGMASPYWRVGGTSGATIFRRISDSNLISSSKLCMFAVYNRALTDDEVAALYNNELNARSS